MHHFVLFGHTFLRSDPFKETNHHREGHDRQCHLLWRRIHGVKRCNLPQYHVLGDFKLPNSGGWKRKKSLKERKTLEHPLSQHTGRVY